MTSTNSAETWTALLAETLAGLLSGQMSQADRAAALTALAASHTTGQAQIDTTRARILNLLAQRESLIGAGPTTPTQQTTPALPGISLVALDHGPTRLTMAAVRNWLTAPVDELLLVDAHTTPPLAQRLAEARLTDPRLRVIRLDAPLSWTRAFNIGLQTARHARLWLLSDTTRLATPAPTAADLPTGSFAATPDQPETAGFFLDLTHSDQARFHPCLETADGAVEDLTRRLTAQGLQRQAVPQGLLTTGPKPAAPEPAKTTGSLRDVLLSMPGFAALQNRHLASLLPAPPMPPLRPTTQDDLGQHIDPGPAPQIPPQTKAEATRLALCHLMQARLGGRPDRLSPQALDMVLNRPASDATATDIAVAGSAPGLVQNRKGWLVLTVAADALPLQGSPAAQGLATLITMAEAHQQVPVLVIDSPDPDAAFPCPVVPAPLDASFWPTELRELARPLGDRTPRHATMDFNRQTLADLQRLALAGPAVLNRRPKLFIDAQHGLGNRMRAIASAGAIAKGTDRELVIIWQQDDHCACAYDDLFFPDGAVLTQGFASEAASLGMRLYNYMEIEPGAVKDAPIQMGAFEDVYIRSAFPLISPCSNWHSENTWIHNMNPNEVVRALVASVRSPNDLSIHIRMEGGAAFEHLPYEAPANWTAEAHQNIAHWRERSHFRHFLPRLDTLIGQGLADRVFLAADTPAVYDEFQARYGKRIAWLPRPSSDRSAQSIVYALADALLLGRAPRLLGSTWSSFSELAARLAPAPMTVELTGRDF